MVTKSNAQRHGMVLWDKVFYEVAEDYPDVTWDKMLVDAMTVRSTFARRYSRRAGVEHMSGH
mgnify:FL=1